MSIFKASEVLAHGVKGTYKTYSGAIGLGYKMPDGSVVRSGGNGFYYLVPPLLGFWPDGGDNYMRAVNGLSIPPAYKV